MDEGERVSLQLGEAIKILQSDRIDELKGKDLG